MIESVSDAVAATASVEHTVAEQISVSGLTKESYQSGYTACLQLGQILAGVISTTASQGQDVEKTLSILNDLDGYLSESGAIAQARGWDSMALSIAESQVKLEEVANQMRQSLTDLTELRQSASITRSVVDRLSEGMAVGGMLSEKLQEQLSASRHDLDGLMALIASTAG